MRRKPLSIAFRVTEEQHKMINEKERRKNVLSLCSKLQA